MKLKQPEGSGMSQVASRKKRCNETKCFQKLNGARGFTREYF